MLVDVQDKTRLDYRIRGVRVDIQQFQKSKTNNNYIVPGHLFLNKLEV